MPLRSPPSSPSTVRASSTVWTPMTLERAALRLPFGLLDLLGRHEEVVGARILDGDGLLAQPADVPDRPVEVDRAGGGDAAATGEIARRELVEQGQREGQAGRRATDLIGRDRRRDGQLVADVVVDGAVDGDEADDRPAVRRTGQRDGDLFGLLRALRVDRQGHLVARRLPLQEGTDVVGQDDRLTVHGDDGVAGVRTPRRPAPAARRRSTDPPRPRTPGTATR